MCEARAAQPPGFGAVSQVRGARPPVAEEGRCPQCGFYSGRGRTADSSRLRPGRGSSWARGSPTRRVDPPPGACPSAGADRPRILAPRALAPGTRRPVYRQVARGSRRACLGSARPGPRGPRARSPRPRFLPACQVRSRRNPSRRESGI